MNFYKSFLGIKKSLTGRVLFIAVLFLIIPFLIMTFFHYSEDIKIKKQGALIEFETIGREMQQQILQTVATKQDILDTVHLILSPTKRITPQLAAIAEQMQASAILHLTATPGGAALCDAASIPTLVGTTHAFLLERKRSGDAFGFLPSSQEFFLFSELTDNSTAWVALFSLSSLIDNWDLTVDSPLETALSLFNKKGELILTTNPALSEQAAFLEAQILQQNIHFIEGQHFIIQRFALPRSQMILLLSSVAELNFSNIPYLFLKLAILTALVTFFGGIGTFIVSYYLSKPFKRLTSVMQQVSAGDLQRRFHPSSLGFEVNTLGVIFNRVVDSLVQRIDEVKREKTARELLKQELLIGQKVHQSIIPKNLPHFPSLDIAARFVSAKEVGGDFYDFLPRKSLSNEQLLFAVADTSGKGIYACLYALTIRSILRSYGLGCSPLEEIIRQTNALFCQDTADSGVFVTMWLGLFDQETKRLTFASCGHHPALLKRSDGSVTALSTPGMALGATPDMPIESSSVQLASGDLLVSFTDGVIEAHNEKMEMFSEEKVVAFLRAQEEANAHTVVSALLDEITAFANQTSQYDDITVIALRVL